MITPAQRADLLVALFHCYQDGGSPGELDPIQRLIRALPLTTDPAPVVDPLAAVTPYEVRFTATQEPFSFRLTGPARVGVAVADGFQVLIGYSVKEGDFVEGQAGGGNGAGQVILPCGYVVGQLQDGAKHARQAGAPKRLSGVSASYTYVTIGYHNPEFGHGEMRLDLADSDQDNPHLAALIALYHQRWTAAMRAQASSGPIGASSTISGEAPTNHDDLLSEL